MKELIESRIAELKRKPFADLAQLPNHQNECVKDNGKVVNVAIWKDEISPKKLRIVVQGYRYLFLGFGRMEAKGFMVDDKEEVRELRREEIYQFV